MDCQEVDQWNNQLAVTARPEGQPVADGDNADPKGADAGADGGDRKPGAAEAPAEAAVTAPPPNTPPSKRAVEAAGQAAEEWSQPKKPRPVVVVPPPPPAFSYVACVQRRPEVWGHLPCKCIGMTLWLLSPGGVGMDRKK